MSIQKTFATPAALKASLEQRIRTAAEREGIPITRCRQRLLFERLLGRLQEEFGERLIAKGGVALELRLARARTTLDLDVHVCGNRGLLLRRIQAAGRRDMGDSLAFAVTVPTNRADAIQGDGVVYEGKRYRVQAELLGSTYGQPFGLDVAVGEVVVGKVDAIEGSDFFDFVGAQRTRIKLYPRETHLAEKLHAYTFPREDNSRVKDLPDLALLGGSWSFESQLLFEAFKRKFEFRGTHPLPARLPPPPADWSKPYVRMAEENQLPWKTLDAVFRASAGFLDPLLNASDVGTWDPAVWAWKMR